MKVLPTGDGLIVTPESEFETHWLAFNFNDIKSTKIYLKYGMSADYLIGLKIKIGEDDES